MTRRAAAILLLVLLAAVGALLWMTRTQSTVIGRRQRRPFLRVSVPPAVSTPGTAPVTPPETVRLTLFFPGKEDAKLRPEERDVPKPSDPGAFLRAIFAELQKGPMRSELTGALPSKLQLRNAFLLPDGEVLVDLAVDASLSFGSEEELTIVASIVDTVLQNVADTRRVRILVNGEPAESLGGHVDLTRPLLYLRGELAT